jgi:hypothetical protein
MGLRTRSMYLLMRAVPLQDESPSSPGPIPSRTDPLAERPALGLVPSDAGVWRYGSTTSICLVAAGGVECIVCVDAAHHGLHPVTDVDCAGAPLGVCDHPRNGAAAALPTRICRPECVRLRNPDHDPDPEVDSEMPSGVGATSDPITRRSRASTSAATVSTSAFSTRPMTARGSIASTSV